MRIFYRLCKMSSIMPPPQSLLKPMNFPRKSLYGPGPSNCPPRVLAACALPLLGHCHPEFFQIMDEIKEGVQYAFQTQNELTLAISGTGHAGMEAAVCNMVEPKDVVVVFSAGLWGERFADMAERHDADVRVVEKPMGAVFTLDDVKQALDHHKPSVAFIAHSESSSTVMQPLEGIGDLCKSHNCILIVDCVASLGGAPMFMDQWNIDVLYSGSQKVLSCPPGAAPISLNQRARNKLAARKTKVRSFYLDMNWLGNYWGCDGQPRKYHHTGPISSMYALREGLSMLVEEGLEECQARHQKCANILYEGLEKMGLKPFVKNKAHRLPTLTAVEVPDGIDWKKVSQYAMDKYKIELAGGLGASAGKVWRLGFMGYNAQPENVRTTLRVLQEGIEWSKAGGDAK
ncbi:serine--pyruvate aminotransferase isoform X3 [Lingula anatina]|uniref:Alanine--glyoxylate aminotransferase n=1 Tax=Lingula anatina TaxID=7574 RepID=A0A1S3IE17_LINAN|nr:serine--pyruvate aminotransferase isoform X2 [Lingula anatina]XP_013416979.1 serine--pyruvate aminotransferase isoform X3 [Lingula anatina]|eukprot:XP_013395699.1 serine--pyruvate aminotransferase isoform X2 [Lingula anatina]